MKKQMMVRRSCWYPCWAATLHHVVTPLHFVQSAQLRVWTQLLVSQPLAEESGQMQLFSLDCWDSLCSIFATCAHIQHIYQELGHLCLKETTWKAWKINKQYSIYSGWFVMKTYTQWRHKTISPPPHGTTALVGPGVLIVEVSRSHSDRHATLSRTPLDEWVASHRAFYLTTHNTHKRQTSMLPAGFKPRIPANE